MKKIKFILAMVCIAGITSCEDFENKVFDNVNGKTLASFGSLTYDLPITINATGSADLQVNVTTVSDVDRTFDIAVDLANSTAVVGSYAVPTSVTIPAGQYSGTLTLTGTDVAGVETTPETLTLNIVSGEGTAVGPATVVSVFQICPVPSTYMVGQYQITNLVSRFGRALIETKVATITAPSPTTRAFSNKLLGGTSDSNVVLSLICNEIIFTQVSSTLQCTAGNLIQYGPATNNSTYDVTDDSLFLVNYNFDITNSCAASPTQTNSSFIMTKL